MKLHISIGCPADGDWHPLSVIEFPNCTNSWLVEGRLPTEEENLPKREIFLPSGEPLELGLARFAEPDTTNIFAFSAGKNFLSVMSSGMPQLIFTTPGGTLVSVAIYDVT